MYIHYIALNSIHGSDFVLNKVNGLIDLLFLYVKSPSTFIIDDRIFTITNPSVLLIDSYTPHKYFPTGTRYMDDYLHFAVEDRKSFLKELTFPLNQPIPLSNDTDINHLLQMILNENNPNNKYTSQIESLLIKLLMLKVNEQWDYLNQEKTDLPHFPDLLAVRNMILHSPEKLWTVEELAEHAHLSQSYFQVMYKKAFGITCITDVINVKTSQAKVLLTSTDLQVNQVAKELGYNDVYHFIRQFKKNTGLTPGTFRKKAGLEHLII
ncbi:helix-turn-helix transcriptional regulator [Anaerocolumna jejuensis]|uniref:helix-turn-helix transcriptional regulator n=1 Tax=Anaerocolumna jejuensis TaxID=259063 RepID=UPI003F7C5F79